jgi:protease-4
MRTLAPLLALLGSGCFFTQVDIPLGGGRHADFVEKTVQEDDGYRGKIALIDVEGVLTSESRESLLSSKESQVVALVQKLKIAEADADVKAVVLRIDSPGGDVTTSDVLYNEIAAFKRRKNVPVVAAFMGVAASGAYYLASAADTIVAHPTTITGSIGVIAFHFSLSGLLEKIGVKATALKSGASKDSGSPFRDLTDADRRIFEQLIGQFYDRFVGVVAEGRKGKLSPEQVRGLADGRIFTAAQALEAKLVDRVGYLQDAIAEAESRAGLTASKVVMYSRRPKQVENPYSAPAAAASPLGTDLESLRSLLGFHCYYLWEPYLLGK